MLNNVAEYILVWGNYAEDITARINEKLQEGFMLLPKEYHPMPSSNGGIYQPMYKPKEPKDLQ